MIDDSLPTLPGTEGSLEHTPVLSPDPKPRPSFVANVFWNWLGVAALIASGLLLSPYLIRKLGNEAYGVWVLSFSLVEYYVFLDLGFRSATVKYVAHYWALDDPRQINSILNTVIVYSGLVGTFLFALVVFGSQYLHRFFKISPTLAPTFRLLVILVSLSWCLGFVFNAFGACLEAVQRFDVYTKVNVTTAVLRAGGTAILLYLGYGLIEVGVLAVASQILGYLLYFLGFRSIFPKLRISRELASIPTLKMMGNFGIHTFLANISNLFLSQSPPVLIAHFLPAAFVGFYAVPNRLVQYTGEAVSRIGTITNARTAELQAKGESHKLTELAVYINRYCVTLFMPLAIVFWVFGDRILKLWVPTIALNAAPLLPVLLAGYMIAVAGQFSSGMLLQGLGRHQRYARGLMVEALASFGALIYVIPRYGILGAAWVVAISMTLNRGLFLPWLVSRELGFSFGYYLYSIYARPALSAIPVAVLAVWLRTALLPGNSWLQLIAVSAIIGAVYFGLAILFCLPHDHRVLLRGWIENRIAARLPATERP